MTTKINAKSISSSFEVDGPVMADQLSASSVSEAETPLLFLPWLTLERVLYGLLFGLALALRLWYLTDYPLSNAEAGQSLLAWRLYHGQGIEGGGYSPLLVTLQALTFFLLGPDDASARLAAVLLGSGLVLLPLTLRRHLGAKVSLLTMALLALSPTAVFLSRTVNSEIGVAVGALMLISGLFNWAEDGRRRWLWLGSGGLALLFTAGPMAYSVIIVFAIILLVRWAYFKELWRQGWELDRAANLDIQPETGSEPTAEDDSAKTQNDARQPAASQVAPLYFFLFCLALLATVATFNLSGLSAVSSLLTDWLGRFSAQSRPDSGFNAVFVLTIYEPMLVLIGLAGLAYAILERDLFKETLASWFIGAIVLDVLMGGRPAGSAILPLAPLAFLAALALAELWSGLQREGSWGNEGLLLAAGLVIGTFAYIGLTGWLTCNRPDNICLYGWVQPVAAVSMFFIIVAFFWFMTNANIATRGAALAGVALGLLITINIGWRLNYGPLMDLAYQPLAGIPASTELVALTETLSKESAARAGGQLTALDTTLNVNSPALLWRLRNFDKLTQVSSLVGAQAASAIITPANVELGLGTPYLGQSFGLDSVWSPVGLEPKTLLGWLLFRHTETRPQQGSQVVLWLRLTEN